MINQNDVRLLFPLLRSAVCGTKLTEEERGQFSTESLQDLMKIAEKHDVSHLFAYGLKQNGLIPQGDGEIEKCIFKAVFRFERTKYEYEKLCGTLEKEKIPFLPLKGSVLRAYYPEGWMRTSCDIDVLVKESDLDRATTVLTEQLGYTFKQKNSHDVSFFTPNQFHIELHYALIEESISGESFEILKDVWEKVTLREGFGYWYEMPDETFYFYHISHMAKHLQNGGCGIRPFIDLWILDHLPEADLAKRDALLQQGKCMKFASAARKLSRIWFSDEEFDAVSKQMENYILRGGVYGSEGNRIAVQQQKQGGKFKYLLSKIFLPYEEIKFHYPILEKHRWLTPFMEIRRWCKLIFCGHMKRSVKELSYNQSISSAEEKATKEFLFNIGL